MQAAIWVPIFSYIAILMLLTPALGSLFFAIFNFPQTRFEKGLLALSGCSNLEQNWKEYLRSLIQFQILGFVAVFLLTFLNRRASIPWDLGINIAASYVTNTNWQAYAGESTLDNWFQMLALTVQNFLSPAVSLSVMLVLIRGLKNDMRCGLGNFWSDLTRVILFVLLPGSFMLALFLVSQGSVQNWTEFLFAPNPLPMGPAASQTAIAVLGSNGGGYFGTNLAHPFANPTFVSNFVLSLVILALPAGLVHFFGRQIEAPKQARVLLSVMFGLFLLFLCGIAFSELSFGSLEGRELRFLDAGTILLNAASTASSNGSTNAALESLSPLASGFMLLQIMLGEIIFGGVGSGLYGMLLFVLLTVFLAGLMVGRTPEYLGKKIDASDVLWILVGILGPSVIALTGTGLFAIGPASGTNSLSEMLYAFVSCANNNGSSLAGGNTNTPLWNVALGGAMLLGRFSLLIPVAVLAGQLSKKKIIPPSSGTFQTDTPLFAGLLFGTIVIVGALTFMPGWCLGPLLEHIRLIGGAR